MKKFLVGLLSFAALTAGAQSLSPGQQAALDSRYRAKNTNIEPESIVNTALTYAAQSGRANCVRLLLDAGADMNAVDEVRGTCECWLCVVLSGRMLVVARSARRLAIGMSVCIWHIRPFYEMVFAFYAAKRDAAAAECRNTCLFFCFFGSLSRVGMILL